MPYTLQIIFPTGKLEVLNVGTYNVKESVCFLTSCFFFKYLQKHSHKLGVIEGIFEG